MTLGASAPLGAQGLSGSYLAGKQASRKNDHEQAARYYTQALSHDPGNHFLLQSALMAFLAKGDVDRSVVIAHKILASQIGTPLADLVSLAAAIKSDNFSEAQRLLDDGVDRFSPLLSGLLSGWVALGAGNMTSAIARFDATNEPAALRRLGQYHKALALASVGDFDTADKILSNDTGGAERSIGGSLIARVLVMVNLGREDEAIALLDDSLVGAPDQVLIRLREKIAADGVVSYDFVTSASEGAAEVFLTLASVFKQSGNEPFSLFYSQLAEYLRPDYADAILLTAEILHNQEQYDLAIRTYATVAHDDPLFLQAELGRSRVLVSANRQDASIEVLRGLTHDYGDVAYVHIMLGDVLYGQKLYAEATHAYDIAVSMIPNPTRDHWFLFYRRGIIHEESDKWEQAEADFRRALQINPGEPRVLNYLGYSLIELGVRLDEAQAMIERASAARPNDGYITDSLGWALYRTGKYEDAVEPMERAVEQVPTDPVVNDHLGDVYWKVNRKREAEFQWHRALSFEPEEKDALRIFRKLEVGLDAVIAETKALETASGDDN